MSVNPLDNKSQAWSALFSEPMSELVKRYTASVFFDKRLWKADIQGSLAHAEMLNAQGLLSAEDWASIQKGMAQITSEIESGTFEWKLDLEDVHLNIEARLTQLVGDAGKRLHTGRSRNDQVATDVRLWLRTEIDILDGLLNDLQKALLTVAEQNVEVERKNREVEQARQALEEGALDSEWSKLRQRAASSASSARATVTVPVAATYQELQKAMTQAFTGGKLYFSKEHPNLYLEKPEVYASGGQLVIKVHLDGFVKKGGRVYASDWSYEYVRQVFPGFVSWKGQTDVIGSACMGGGGDQAAPPVDPGLAAWLTAQGQTLDTVKDAWTGIDGVHPTADKDPNGMPVTETPKVWVHADGAPASIAAPARNERIVFFLFMESPFVVVAPRRPRTAGGADGASTLAPECLLYGSLRI